MACAGLLLVLELPWSLLEERSTVPWSGLILVGGVGICIVVAVASEPRRVRAALRENRGLVALGLAWAAAHLLSAAFADRWDLPLRWAARSIASAALLVVLTSLDHTRTRAWMARAAAVLVGALSVAWVAGMVFEAAEPWFFERVARHQHVGGIARFRGFWAYPSLAGLELLGLAGLAWQLEAPRVRWGLVTLGLGLAVTSLSFASFPAIGVAWALGTRRRPRLAAVGLAACIGVGAAALYVKPVELCWGDHRVPLLQQPPAFYHDGLGPRWMPRHELRLGPMAVAFHFNGYAYLAANGLACFAKHPLTGVGGNRVRERCPTRVMNTAGDWGNPFVHDGLVRVAAELGLPGLLVALLIAGAVARRLRRAPLDTRVFVLAAASAILANDDWAGPALVALVGSSMGEGEGAPAPP